MMKIVYTEKYLMRVATGLLREALLKVPAVVIEAIEHEGRLPDRTMVDIVIRIRYANRPYTLLGEVKTNGQPRHRPPDVANPARMGCPHGSGYDSRIYRAVPVP